MAANDRKEANAVACSGIGLYGPETKLTLYYSIIYNIIDLRTRTVNRTRFYYTAFVMVFVLCRLAEPIRCSLIRFVPFEASDIRRAVSSKRTVFFSIENRACNDTGCTQIRYVLTIIIHVSSTFVFFFFNCVTTAHRIKSRREEFFALCQPLFSFVGVHIGYRGGVVSKE